jgi:hypothetical protein
VVVDPMTIKSDWRDRFPKTKLDKGYVGDKLPLCADLPTSKLFGGPEGAVLPFSVFCHFCVFCHFLVFCHLCVCVCVCREGGVR